MIETINFYEFSDRFLQSDNYKNNFSYEGLKALFNYLEEYEEETGEQIEFDMIAICCDYTEYSNWKELKADYKDYFKENNIKNIEDLKDYCQVIELENGGIIISNI